MRPALGREKSGHIQCEGESMVQEYVTWALPHFPAGIPLMTGTNVTPFPNTPAKFITEQSYGKCFFGCHRLAYYTFSWKKYRTIGHLP